MEFSRSGEGYGYFSGKENIPYPRVPSSKLRGHPIGQDHRL
jgi:hypothetical protein